MAASSITEEQGKHKNAEGRYDDQGRRDSIIVSLYDQPK